MSRKTFFDENVEFKVKIEEIIRSGDIKILQALIGKKNAVFLLQYVASFFITKMNIKQAQCQAEILVPKQIREHCIEKLQAGNLPTNASDYLNGELRNVILKTKDDLYDNKILLPNPDLESGRKFLLDSNAPDLRIYVRETNIGNLCTMSFDQVTMMYETLLKKKENDTILNIDLKGTPEEITKRLKTEIEDFNLKLDVVSEELRTYSDSLYKIKNGLYLDEWHQNLIQEIVRDATNQKNHILYQTVKTYQEINEGNLNCNIVMIIARNLRKLWNKELLIRVFKKLHKKCSDQDIAKLFDFIDLSSEDIINTVSAKFEQLKIGNDENEIVKCIINDFVPSIVIKEEQNIVNEVLLYATQQKKKDAILLLVFNGANYAEVGNDSFIDEKIAFLEIKRIYKLMPRIELPTLSLEEVTAVYPEDDDLNKLAGVLEKQKDVLSDKKEKINKILSKEYPFYLFFMYLRNISAKINKGRIKKAEYVIDNLIQSFEESMGCACPKPFLEEIDEIKKDEGWFSLNKKTFKQLEEIDKKIANAYQILSVGELADQLITSKEGYIKHKHEEEIVQKQAPQITEKYAKQLKIKMENDAREKRDLQKLKERAEAKAEEERKAREEEQKAKETERKAKEAAEEKAKLAEIKTKALTLMYDEAVNSNVKVSTIEEHIKEYLLQLYVFILTNSNYTKEFENLLNKFQDIRKELKTNKKSANRVFELEIISERLVKDFVENKNAEEQFIKKYPLCSGGHLTFLAETILKMKKSCEKADESRKNAEMEKKSVLEMVKKL